MLLDTVKKKKGTFKTTFKALLQVDKTNRQERWEREEFAPCRGPSSWAYVSGTNKALKENVLNSLFTYY